MIKNNIKYLLVVPASICTMLLLTGILGGFISLINKAKLGTTYDLMGLIMLLIFLCLFSYLAYKHGNKYSVYAIAVALSTAIIIVVIEGIDMYFTNDFALTNGWLNLFGWDKYESGEEPMGHRIYGIAVIILPTITLMCSVLLYSVLIKNQKKQ